MPFCGQAGEGKPECGRARKPTAEAACSGKGTEAGGRSGLQRERNGNRRPKRPAAGKERKPAAEAACSGKGTETGGRSGLQCVRNGGNGMIVIKIGDGMGNQMYNYACGYALSRRTGEKLKLDISECDNSTLRDYELDFFRVCYDGKESFPNRNVWQKIYKRLRRNILYHVIIEKNWYAVDERIYKKTLRSRYLHGYWQNTAYFLDCLPELREMFVPREPLREEVQELSERFAANETCAIHVRGGDIGGPSPEYFREAIRRMREERPGAAFFVFTNDKKKAAECIGDAARPGRSWQPGEIRYIGDLGTFTDKEEFLLMSACQNQILSNSSFSAWAAYLNRNPNALVMVPGYKGVGQTCLDCWQIIGN